MMLGCQDSNLGIAAPKAAALPLGYTPMTITTNLGMSRPCRDYTPMSSVQALDTKKQSPTHKTVGPKR